MHMLVLDPIHGGKIIADAFATRGNDVDLVDVYRQESAVDVQTALTRRYDRIVAPVHLDPAHPLLAGVNAPVISHHEAVRELLGDHLPHPMVEITGSRGKTTTAFALASLMPGAGILHTSSGTFRYPDYEPVSRSSITPASVLGAVRLALDCGGWLIAEESLGVTGAGELAIITSAGDYAFAAGKKQALAAKVASAKNSPRVLLARDVPGDGIAGAVRLDDMATCTGTECTVTAEGRTWRFANPLLALPAYRDALMLAAAAAALLGIDPSPLAGFAALPGRMSVEECGDVLVVDNANSGTDFATTVEAARYARGRAGCNEVTLVIGQQEGDGAVCAGFSPEEILAAIEAIRPAHLIWVGKYPAPGSSPYERLLPGPAARVSTLAEGTRIAKRITAKGSIILAVKTWR